MNFYIRSSVITLQDAECCGCPLARKTDENVDQARELFRENRRIAIHEFGNIWGISFGTVQRILKDNLSKHQIAA
jgi:Fe-S oxidoreductase